MEQSDYLLRQIHFMTQALVSLIRRLLGQKDIHENEIYNMTDEVLKEQLEISLEQVMNTQTDAIVDRIVGRKGMQETNTDLFADILVINAKARHRPEERVNLLIKALELYQWTDRSGNTYSQERQKKMDEIRVLLQKDM